MNAMDELVQWLRAQLDEDEQAARAATDGPWTPWRSAPLHGLGDLIHAVLTPGQKAGSRADIVTSSWLDAEHIARHDPARALREIEAKRRRLDRHRPERRRLTLLDSDGGTTSFGFYVCTACTPNRTIEHGQDVIEWPCPEVRDDAAAFSDRTGYREEWRP